MRLKYEYSSAIKRPPHNFELSNSLLVSAAGAAAGGAGMMNMYVRERGKEGGPLERVEPTEK